MKDLSTEDGERTIRAAKVNEITSNTMCVDTNGLAKDYLRCGRKTAVDIGTSANARIQVGKRVLWNLKKIQQYIDSISE